MSVRSAGFPPNTPRIMLPRTTTDATPVSIYTSPAVSVGSIIYVEGNLFVANADNSAISNIALKCTISRATAGNVRAVTQTSVGAVGEILAINASAAITVNTGAQTFSIMLTGKAATTYTWSGFVTIQQAV